MLPSPSRPAPAPAAAEFTSPLSLPGGSIAGAELVRELPAEVALPAWHTLRAVLLWAQVPPGARGALFEEGGMAAWEARVLTGTLEEAVRSPLAVLARELTDPETASAQQIAWACFCVTEWALGRRAISTAIVFAEAAALAWPEHPRYAWAAGRLMRTHGKFREAEIWIRRAVRTAVRCSDWESQVLGLNSLGNVLYEQGSYGSAYVTLRQALTIAQRHGLRELEAEINHDLFSLTRHQDKVDEAEAYAKAAYEFYCQRDHPRMAALAHDVAYMWMRDGYFCRSLRIFVALLDRFHNPAERVRVLANAARAAAGCGDEESFADFTREARELARTSESGAGVATALVELAVGATIARDWKLAEEVLQLGLELGRKRGESDVVVRADQVGASIRNRCIAEARRNARDHLTTVTDDPLASGFVTLITNAQQLAMTG